MRTFIRGKVLLASALLIACAAAGAQQAGNTALPQPASFDLGLTFSPERAQQVPGKCCFWMQGGGVDAAATFWKGLGIAAAVTGGHISNYAPGMDVNKIAYLGGPRFTYTVFQSHAAAAGVAHYQVFAEGLFGAAHAFNGEFPVNGALASSASSLAIQAGGGFNLFLTPHIGLRLAEADYIRTALPNGAANVQNDLRLAAGLTYRSGGATPAPITLTCAASPAEVFAGDPITLTASAAGLTPRLNAVYSWSGAGASGNGPTVSVATGSLAPGVYAVKCAVKEGKPGKEGLKAWESAQASTSFVVKPWEPPTVSCTASPATIKPGDTAAISAVAVSPQNRALTLSYSASAGSINGSGSSAVFSSAGAPTGVVEVTCTAADDVGHSVAAHTTVTITAPYVLPVPHAQALCAISFERDKARPTRVDNEAKACLDQVALVLREQPDAKVVLVAHANAAEKQADARLQKAALKHKHAKPADRAAERAVNTRQYLVTEKGIDATRIQVVTGAAESQQVENYLVPGGASFSADVTGTTSIDESKVKPEVRKPLAARRAHKKHGHRNRAAQ